MLMYGDALTDLERDAMATMLRHDHPVTTLLRAQLDECRIKGRELTGVGFFTDIVVPQALAVPGLGSMHLNDAVVEIAGLEHGVGFVLFIRDGKLDVLEGFTYDEPWPDKIGNYSVGPAETLTPGDLRALQFAERRMGGS
jgi:hypothetical protein